MKKLVSLSIIIVCLFSFSFASSFDDNRFAVETVQVKTNLYYDVSPSHWCYMNILNMKQRGIINGYPDQTFRGEIVVKRGEFAKMLGSTFGYIPGGQSIALDVKSKHWADPYIAPVESFFTKFPNGMFLADRPVTRLEAILAITAAKGMTTELADLSVLDIYKDKASVPTKHLGAVANALSIGILTGFSDDTLKLNNLVDRYQAAALLTRSFDFGEVAQPVLVAPSPTPTPITTPSVPVIVAPDQVVNTTVEEIRVNLRSRYGQNFEASETGYYEFVLNVKAYTPFWIDQVPQDSVGHWRTNIMIFKEFG